MTSLFSLLLRLYIVTKHFKQSFLLRNFFLNRLIFKKKCVFILHTQQSMRCCLDYTFTDVLHVLYYLDANKGRLTCERIILDV